MRKTIIFCLWGLVGFAILMILAKDILCYSSSFENLFIGLLASSFVVLIIELVNSFIDRKRYSYLSGTFKRLKIFNKRGERKGDTIYDDLTTRYNDRNVNSEIQIKDHGEGRFTGVANYEEGKQSFELFLDKTNPSYGKGSYQYIEKHQEYMKSMPDFGHLELIQDKNDSRTIYIVYKNISPSGITEGYEIWRK